MDPTGLGEGREEKLRAYRQVRDQIKYQVIKRFGEAKE
jgi:arsenate reductase